MSYTIEITRATDRFRKVSRAPACSAEHAHEVLARVTPRFPVAGWSALVRPVAASGACALCGARTVAPLKAGCVMLTAV